MSVKTKNIVRILVFALLICLTVSLFTGCGMVPEGKGGSGNKLSHVNGKKITTLTFDSETDKATTHDLMLFKATKIKATYDSTKLGFNGYKYNLDIFRQLAITMYSSIFAESTTTVDPTTGETTVSANEEQYKTDLETKYGVGSKDNFVNPANDMGAFVLSPTMLIKSTNTKTMEAIKDNGPLQTMIDVIKAVAATLLIALWSMGFIDQIVNEKFTMETLLKTLMQLMCGILLIVEGDTIVEAFAAVGNYLVDAFDPGLGNNAFTAFKNGILKDMTENIWAISMGANLADIVAFAAGTVFLDLGPFMAILYMAAPLIAMVICAYKIVSAMIMRMLELLVRITFAPIPLAFSARNGFSQSTISYLRGIMACAMQPVLMLAGCACVGTISDAVMGIFGGKASSDVKGLMGALAMTLSYFVLSAYLGQTERLSKDIIAR